MIKKSWNDFFERLESVDFEEFDLIVAIARGGIIPASFIQQQLNIPMKIIQINYRDDEHNPRYDNAKLLEENEFYFKDKKILLVDDVSRTGKTLAKATEYLNGNIIRTCIVNGKGDYSLFNEESCIEMPWKRG